MKFFYVYILQSKAGEHFYIGFTENLQARLKDHNSGKVPHSTKFRPWRIKTAIAFTDRQRAIEFEHYLKSPQVALLPRKDFNRHPSPETHVAGRGWRPVWL